MAKVSKQYVTRPRTIIENVEEITLVMSKEEAIALNWVLNRIGGDPENSARKYIDAIHKEMNQTLPTKDAGDTIINPDKRVIYFLDGSDKLCQ